MWTDDWTGIPYAKGGRGPEFDCAGLYIALNRARFGRDIPDPAYTHRREEPAAWASVGMREVTDIQEGDALLFRAGRGLHIGYALGGRDMLHVENEACSVIERWDCTRWRSRLVGVFRYDA